MLLRLKIILFEGTSGRVQNPEIYYTQFYIKMLFFKTNDRALIVI